mmetsp:Transcript_13206/g.19278  ORF Transcript_13206/g.19278 Transcript_13206/m.19278 type:complete len:236 (+) Transcript_13206:358-1065(+)
MLNSSSAILFFRWSALFAAVDSSWERYLFCWFSFWTSFSKFWFCVCKSLILNSFSATWTWRDSTFFWSSVVKRTELKKETRLEFKPESSSCKQSPSSTETLMTLLSFSKSSIFSLSSALSALSFLILWLSSSLTEVSWFLLSSSTSLTFCLSSLIFSACSFSCFCSADFSVSAKFIFSLSSTVVRLELLASLSLESRSSLSFFWSSLMVLWSSVFSCLRVLICCCFPFWRSSETL